MTTEQTTAADGGNGKAERSRAPDHHEELPTPHGVLELAAATPTPTTRRKTTRLHVRDASLDDPLERLADKRLVFISQLTSASDLGEALMGLAADAADLGSFARAQLERIAKERLVAAGIRGQAKIVERAFASTTKRRGPRALGGWESELTRLPNGRYAPTVGNLLAVLRYHPAWDATLGFNERSGQVLWIAAPPWRASECESWVQCELRDSDHPRIAEWFERSQYEITVSPGSEALHGALVVASEDRRFDPVVQYLDALRWDGVPRLDQLLSKYFGAKTHEELEHVAEPKHAAEPEYEAESEDVQDDEQPREREYLRAVGSRAMIAAVARAYAPGCKADHVLVLAGPQGVGKSSGIRILAGSAHFADSLPDLRHKDAADYVRAPWIVELSELDAMRRSELSTVKAFVTRTHDRFRAAYGRVTESHPRRCVFFGSTNEDTFLADASGNRRFWPVTVGSVDLQGLQRDRDQLWAEAVARYRSGEPWHLNTQQLALAAVQAQEERQVVDPWQPAIAAYVAGRARVGVQDVLRACIGLELEHCTQLEANRVARVLRQLGWVRRQVREGKQREWLYVAPSEKAS